jgi:hypothetical protein
MNMAMLKKCQGPSETSLVKRGRVVTLPPSMATYQLGQRLYFCKTTKGILMTVVPKRTWNGRLLSTRVRRAVRTLAAFGPRAGKKSS